MDNNYIKDINKKEIIIKVFRVILVIIWMCVVFKFSSEVSEVSSNTSGGTIEIILKLIKHDWTPEELAKTTEMLQPYIRKLAHFTLYAIGGFLIYGLNSNSKKIEELEKKNKKLNKFSISAVVGFIYSITDEIHQEFVPGREGRIYDVGIDSLGILFGCFIRKIFNKILKII